MELKKHMKISEFAKLSGISRKTLIYYDEIGLLPPEIVEENQYRFYSLRQLETVTVISSLRELGMPLKEIQSYLDRRSPENLIDLFTEQTAILEQKIQKLKRIQEMMQERIRVTESSKYIDPDMILLKECPEEKLFVSPDFQYTGEDSYMDALFRFYDLASSAQIAYGCSVGNIVSKANLLAGLYEHTSIFFCKYPKGSRSSHMAIRPAGLYVIGYGHEYYTTPDDTYQRIYTFIDQHDLVISGNSYEEFLIDEIAAKNADQYLLQIMVQVESK